MMRIDNNEQRLFSLSHSLKKAQALVQSNAKKQSLVKKLKEMRQEDAHND